MRHLKKTKKFKRNYKERQKLLIDLTRGLILNGQITTFTPRAKYFRPFFERLVTLCKRSGEDRAAAIRKMRSYFDEPTSKIMVDKVVPKLTTRNGGYTQLYKISEYFSVHDKSVVRITDYLS
jgi:large subunit ribosomal protein L17